ncbi:hydroxylysine kinase-like [Acanthaster planci]|uniref:Hydroxylysine kinase n=1 Tax=Acanthaster planci TaxID=133434 RepID=A0A8B7XNI9_ACAPL|nr:hydroxylysine kinase-like [Acanthaster planci]
MDAPCISGTVPKPYVTEKEVEQLLARLYSLQAIQIKELPSYEDRTFFLRTVPDKGLNGQTQFILKVLNAEITSQLPSAVAVQMEILDYLKGFPQLKCQVPVTTMEGKLLSYEMLRNDWKNGDGVVRHQDALSAVRMFYYLPGQSLDNLAPLPPPFLYKVGQHIGHLQQVLQTFPGDIEPLKQKEKVFSWSYRNLLHVKQHLGVVEDPRQRALLEDVLEVFRKNVVPILGELRKGIVVHDCNNFNILTTVCEAGCNTDQAEERMTRDFQISGVIDFDETMHAALVNEIAISMMYLMLCCDEPLEGAAHLLAGFESRSPLPQRERGLLRVLIAGRFVLSLVYSVLLAKLHPENDYLTNTQGKGWKCLELLWKQGEEDLMNYWDQIRQLHG